MDSGLYQRIANSSAHTQNRIDNGTFMVQNPHLLQDLITFSFDVKDKLHIRACCILEKVFELQIALSFPNLDFICENLCQLKNDSAIRSLSRFIMLLVQDNAKKKHLTEYQLEKITEVCFDWLISDIRIAPKVHAIYTLFELGKAQNWIHPELKIILEQDSAKHSAGYKVASRETLRKISQHKF